MHGVRKLYKDMELKNESVDEVRYWFKEYRLQCLRDELGKARKIFITHNLNGTKVDKLWNKFTVRKIYKLGYNMTDIFDQGRIKMFLNEIEPCVKISQDVKMSLSRDFVCFGVQFRDCSNFVDVKKMDYFCSTGNT